MGLDQVNRQIDSIYRGRKWIVSTDVAVGAAGIVERLQQAGATSIMLVTAIEGVGDVPQVERIHYTRATGETIMLGVRAYVESIEDPSRSLLAAVSDFDPDDSAQVINASFSRATSLFGRQVYGGRSPGWRALEDKMIADEVWDAAGIERAPSAIVPVDEAAAAASDRLASDLGTVWVADNKEGWHGGGEYLRWVRDEEAAASATRWFADHADRVRVMPFLDGIPCSIHGVITRNGTAVFNPVEMTILRYVDRVGLYYAQGGNFWEPPRFVHREMRAAAASLGSLLADRYGYLGAFGIDGICTVNGFRPTELNPRLSLGHNLHAAAADLPLAEIERSLIAGDLDIDALDLEATVLTKATKKRFGRAMFRFDTDHPPATTGFVIENGLASAADPATKNDGIMNLGHASFGPAIFARFDSERTPIGPSIAPRAVAILDLARDLWEVDAPQLEPAPDLR